MPVLPERLAMTRQKPPPLTPYHQPGAELTLQLSPVSDFLEKTSNEVPRTILLASFVNAISPEGLERIGKHILCAYAHTRAHTGALRSLLMMSCV